MNNTMKMGKCGCISSNIWVVKGDTRSQIVTISVPRMEGRVDLSNLAWYIKIENAAKVTDIRRPEAGSVLISDDTITFDWLICGIATAFVGTTRFAVEGVDETVDGHPIVWRSAPGAIYVGENLDAEISSESEADLSNLQKLIVYVNGELDNVIAAGKAAAESANAAASTNQNIKDAESKRVSAENARVDAENKRVSAEDARVAAETSRANAEALRQSTFEANETNRQAAFDSAETQRASEWSEIKTDVESSVGSAVASASAAAKNANAAADSANRAAERANAITEKSVRYDTAQTLSVAQKAQARQNIGIYSVTQSEYDSLTDTSGIYIIVEG